MPTVAEGDQQSQQQPQQSFIEVPCNVSVDQLRIGSPEAVASIEAQAADKARADERQRLAGLNAAFGDAPEFVAECVSKGLSVEAAKAARFDVVSQQLAEVRTENEKLVNENKDLRARIEKTKVVFVEEPSGEQSDGNEASIESRIDAAWNANGGNCQVRFNGIKTAFAALMKASPGKLAEFEKATK